MFSNSVQPKGRSGNQKPDAKPFYDSKKITTMYPGGDEARETYFALLEIKADYRKEFFDAIEEAVKEIIQQSISSAVKSCLFKEI